jgi:tetratricopeptide (TPR) repeat protein
MPDLLLRRIVLSVFLLLAGLMFLPAPAAADDRALCDNQDTPPDARIAACAARISRNEVKGKDLAITLRNRGLGYAAKGDYDRAIADFEASISADPNYAKAFDSRGSAYYGKHDYDRAIADFERAIKLDPANAIFFRNRALCYRVKRDYDHALADLNEALRIDAKFRDAINDRGIVYEIKNDYDRAIADFSEAVRIDPKFAPAYFSRGVVYGVKGDVDRMLADYDKAIELNPTQAGYFNARAYAWLRKADTDHAMADVEQAIRLAPTFGYVYNTRGEVWRAKGDLDRAIADYSEALLRTPNLGSALVNRGVAYRLKGDLTRAMTDLDEAVRRYWKYGLAYAERGLTLAAKGDRDRARSDFEQVTTLPATNESARKALATAREQLAALGVVAGGVPAAANVSLVPGRRIALVIGNSAYAAVPALSNPQRDAAAVAATLRSIGFQKVELEADLTREKLFNTLRAFAGEAEQADWAVVYYAGHGIEMNGTNYLIPVDAKLATDRDVEFEAVALDKVLSAVDGAKKLRVVLLDACRDNPFSNQMRRSVASRSIGRGLAEVEPDAGTLVVYAAKHGQTALDGEGANSPFVTALINRMKTPGIEVRRLFDLVRDDVLSATSRRQQPFSYGSVSGAEDFYFLQR